MLEKDYHTHSSFSPDAKDSMEKMVLNAIKIGLKEIVFTDHFEIKEDGGPTKSFSDPLYLDRTAKECLRLKEKYDGIIYIGLGIELGQSHKDSDLAEKILSTYPYDFVLASYHKINNIDLSLYDYESIDREELMVKYLSGLLEIAKSSDYDVLSHLDLIKRYAAKKNIKLRIEKEENLVRQILKEVIKRNKAIEINTSGYRCPANESLPSKEVLSWYKEMGGRYVTVGSDSHNANDIARDIDKAEELIKEFNFTFPSYKKRERIQ